MLWFKYKWLLIFSHGLCVKIIRGGQSIKTLSNEIEGFLGETTTIAKGKMILSRIIKIIDTLEAVVFSASALLYREEKDLINFSKKVEDSIQGLLDKCEKDKKRYQKSLKMLKSKMAEFREHSKKLSKKLEKRVEREKEDVEVDKRLKENASSLFEQIILLIKTIERKIYTSRLEAKAQERGTFNMYKVQETIIIRSNFRLGELIGRRGGIEVGALGKKIDELIEIAEKKLKRLKEGGTYAESTLDEENAEIHELVKDSIMEARDLCEVIHFVILASQRVKGWLRIINNRMTENTQLKLLRKEFTEAFAKFEELKKDIFTQVKRLDNEFGIKDIPTGLLKDLKKPI